MRRGKNRKEEEVPAAMNGECRLPARISLREGQQIIQVFVEGYSDVAFWRGIFDDFESDDFTFEISVPIRGDLAKGKKIVLGMAEKNTSPHVLFCVDSDFDYLFNDKTSVAKSINTTPNIFHTYAYAIENFLCYAPSLHNICVKATKNDIRLFDFGVFMCEYSKIVFPLFLWYSYSAQMSSENIFTLSDFRSSVKLNYLEIENNGRSTLEWLQRQVERRLKALRGRHPEMEGHFPAFSRALSDRGVTESNAYMFMQGHTLLDNVVIPMLDAVCDKLKGMCTARINNSQRSGVTLSNELSNYNNALQDIRDAIMFNENYKDCFLYKRLKDDIHSYLESIRK